jgi:hypothetical protein
MCKNHSQGTTEPAEFSAFCRAVHNWLSTASLLDPPLAAAADLLERRAATEGLGWFECEVAHIAWNAEDLHAALGAGVLLSLWNGARAGNLSLP